MKHLNAEELSALLDGALLADRREAAERHLAGCAACRDELAALTEQDALLARTLAHDPGDAYFERFADRVADRIRPRAVSATWWERLLSPRGFALAGSVAAMIAVAGLVWMQSRESGTAALRDPDLTRYQGQADVPVPAAPAPAEPARSDVALESGAVAKEAAPEAGNERKAETEATRARSNAAAPSGVPAGALRQGEAPSSALDAREKRAVVRESRMQEVRRTPEGDEIVAKERALPGAADASPPTAAPPPVAEGGLLQKPRPRASADALNAPLPVQSLSPRDEGSARSFRGAAPTLADADDAGSIRVCGRIVDGEGRPVAGAQVTVVESGRGAIADADGRYCVTTTPGSRTFSVMSIGFGAARREIEIVPGSVAVDFRLEAVNVLPQAPGTAGSRAKGMPSAALETHAPAPWPAAAAPLAARADSLAALAERDGYAARFEEAAAAWQRVAAAARGHVSVPGALSRRAEMLHRAWKAGETPARKAAAIAAVRAYLTAAPRAPAGDPARGWLRDLTR